IPRDGAMELEHLREDAVVAAGVRKGGLEYSREAAPGEAGDLALYDRADDMAVRIARGAVPGIGLGIEHPRTPPPAAGRTVRQHGQRRIVLVAGDDAIVGDRVDLEEPTARCAVRVVASRRDVVSVAEKTPAVVRVGDDEAAVRQAGDLDVLVDG